MTDKEVPRVALVTGGGNGIGLHATLRLLDQGWSVMVADLNPKNADGALEQAAAAGHGDRIDAVGCDVSVEDDVAGAVSATVARFGGLGAIVNNAGVPGAIGPVSEVDVADWDFTFGVLMRGVFLGTKHAVRAFDAGGHGGAIVNVASIAGQNGGVGPQAYSAAKAGVINFTMTTAVELGAKGIRVNAVAPGPVLTPLLARGSAGEERTRTLLADTAPLPLVGTGDHVAAAIVYLLGPDAAFVHGQTITVDGGLLAAGPRDAMQRLVDPRSASFVGVAHGSSGRRDG